MICVKTPLGDVARLKLLKPRVGSAGFQAGAAAIKRALAEGMRAVLLDVSVAGTLRASDMSLLVELAAIALPTARLSLVNARPSLITALRDYGIDEIVPVFATIERAMASPEVKGALLARTPAIVLSAGKGSRIAPLTQMRPKPMLDIMGRPVLEHILRHLKGFGIRDIVLNPGHLGPQISAYFGPGHRSGQSIFYLNEGRWRGGRWCAEPLGSASTLARLVEDHACLATDTLVMCGDALVDIDLPAMMATHRAADADVTIAALNVPRDDVSKYGIIVADEAGRISHFQEKPSIEVARSTLANTGIYILSPRVAGHLIKREGADIASDFLPKLLASGGHLHVFSAPFQWVDIGCGRDYVAAWQSALSGRVNGLTHDAVERRPGIWVHPDAYLHDKADIEGPTYIGSGARVCAGATVRGPAVIADRAVVEDGAFIRNSILMADSRAKSKTIVDGMIASPRWAVAHAFATGQEQPWDPIPGVVPASRNTESLVPRIGATTQEYAARPVAQAG